MATNTSVSVSYLPVQSPILEAQAFTRAIGSIGSRVRRGDSTRHDDLVWQLASVLGHVSCAALLCVDHRLVYQNLASRALLQFDAVRCDHGEDRLPGHRANLEGVCEALRASGPVDNFRMMSLDVGNRRMSAAIVPLSRCGPGMQNASLVLLGAGCECEGLTAQSGMMPAGKNDVGNDVDRPGEPDRWLLTMLFTDIVNSTALVERIGDAAWHVLLERHHWLVRKHLAAFRGREIDTAGDGFFATFDVPARAVRCALAIRDSVRSIGLGIRAGVHTGECEVFGDKVQGVAVHVAARVAAAASDGVILVSSTVKDLVAGSGLSFSGGEWYALKGISEQWRLFCADTGEPGKADR